MKRLIWIGVTMSLVGYAAILFRCRYRGWWEAYDFFVGVGLFAVVFCGAAIASQAYVSGDKESK